MKKNSKIAKKNSLPREPLNGSIDIHATLRLLLEERYRKTKHGLWPSKLTFQEYMENSGLLLKENTTT